LKDRASELVAAYARKMGYDEIVLASTGNAASSMAGITAAYNLKTTIFLPAAAPEAKLIQCLQYGAKLYRVDGNYDTAYDLSLEYSLKYNKLNRNTAYNPLTIEGKKTVSIEIFNDLAKNIDIIFVPVGDGVILSGVIKGFKDLVYTGVLKKLPKIIAVQSEKSRFIYDGFKNDDFNLNYRSTTIADSISVDIARNGYKAVEDIKDVKGDIILVSDDEILKAQKELSTLAGVFAEPAASTSYAGFLKYFSLVEENDFDNKDSNDKNKNFNPFEKGMIKDLNIIILITGSGLKDLKNAAKVIKIPEKYPYKKLKQLLDI